MQCEGGAFFDILEFEKIGVSRGRSWAGVAEVTGLQGMMCP